MASVRAQPCLLTLLLLSVCFSFTSCLYFHIEQTERKCFLEDLPDDTVIFGNFQVQLYDKQGGEQHQDHQDLGIFVAATNPDDKVILSRRYGSKGRFIFTSGSPGRHQICLQFNSSQQPLSAGATLMVHLDVRRAERTNNYTQIAAINKYTELQLRVYQLAQQVEQILKEMNYHRITEGRFREIDHNTNMWIFWWPFVRSLYVVAIIMWHTNSW